MTKNEPAAKRRREAGGGGAGSGAQRAEPTNSLQGSVQGRLRPPVSKPGGRMVRLPGRTVNPQRARLWQELGTNTALFDVTLRASDREVPCNRFILAEESSFFEEKFRSPEFAAAQGAIDLTELDGATLQAVVGSLFTAYLSVEASETRAVLHCADMLDLPVVKAACCQLIQETLSEDTVPRSLQIAEKYKLTSLREAVLAYTKGSFFLFHRTSLRALDKATLTELLTADDLTIFSEMQVFRSVLAWVEEHSAPQEFPLLFGAVRLQHLETFECRSLLAHPLVGGGPCAIAIVEALLSRLEGSRPPSDLPRRDGRRFVWAIDPWSAQSQLPMVRSRNFGLAGSDRSWALSYTSDKLGVHLTCLGDSGGEEDGEDHVPYSPMSQEAAQEEVQLTMVLYDQEDYNRARRWRLPRLTLSPGEYQGFDGFFKDIDSWVRNDRLVVGVQLRLVGKPESPLDDDDAASAHQPHTGGFAFDVNGGSPT